MARTAAMSGKKKIANDYFKKIRKSVFNSSQVINDKALLKPCSLRMN